MYFQHSVPIICTLSLGYLMLVLVLVSGWQQRIVFVFVYTSTEGIAECLCGEFSLEY